jgi:hypothetical protein
MKFKDLELTDDNHFIAMQYYGLILNRTYLVLLIDDRLIGIKVNGLVSIESGDNLLEKKLSNLMAVRGDLQNPYSYIKSSYYHRIQELELTDEHIRTQNRANIVIYRADIEKAYYDPRKKWGMGYYPHDGKVYLITTNGVRKEFIILGNQSGQRIAGLIKGK